MLVNFTEGMARNQTASTVPFFAFISCDANETMSTMTASGNTTASGGSSNGTTVVQGGVEGNGTTNSTLPSTTNSTADSMMNSTLDIFQLAASLDATAAVLYSLTGEVSWVWDLGLITKADRGLSADLRSQRGVPLEQHVKATLHLHLSLSLDDPSPHLPILVCHPSLPRAPSLANLPRNSNIATNATSFNSTLLSASLFNLTGILSGNTNLTTPYLLANLTNLAVSTNSSSPIIVTIGPAPTTPGSVATGTPGGGSGGGSTGGAGRAEKGMTLVGVAAVVLWQVWA